MTILGVDWGEKHTGLALGWTDIGLAQPLTTVDTGDAIAKILSVCCRQSVQKIIIGLSEGKSRLKAQSFASKLRPKTKIPIEFADETLSSAQAKSIRKNHSAAAAFILELWLDEHPPNNVSCCHVQKYHCPCPSVAPLPRPVRRLRYAADYRQKDLGQSRTGKSHL